MGDKNEPSTSNTDVDKNKERKERLNKLHLLRTAGNFVLLIYLLANVTELMHFFHFSSQTKPCRSCG